MFKPSDMSAAENLFIRTYIVALRRRYNDLKAVMYLMHPDNLAVQRFVDATRMVAEMADMHKEFDLRLQAIQQRRKMPYKTAALSKPSADELADMVMLSFFKVVGVINNDQGFIPNKGHGWFSGKPNEWQKFLTNLLDPATAKKELPADDLVSKCMQAIANLFYNNGLHKKKWKMYPPDSSHKYDPYADPADEYFEDDEDEPENPFW